MQTLFPKQAKKPLESGAGKPAGAGGLFGEEEGGDEGFGALGAKRGGGQVCRCLAKRGES